MMRGFVARTLYSGVLSWGFRTQQARSAMPRGRRGIQMSQTTGWVLEEMARVTQAERHAEAARYRMMAAAPGAYTVPRMLLAKALRSLATLVDGEVSTRS